MNGAIAIDPTIVDWHGRDGLHYRARWKDGVLIFKPRLRTLRDLIRWTSGKSQYFASKVMNQVWNATAYSFPGTLYFALWTSTLSASSTGSSSGEAAYTGYARVAATCNTTNFPSSSAGSAIQNANAVTFASNGGAGSETETYCAVLDASTTGQIIYWGSISSTTILAGDTPQINANGMSSQET